MKDKLLEKYHSATKLSFSSPLERWIELFPNKDSILAFWKDVKNTRWPENYGSSPWEDVSTIGYRLENGVSESTRRFLEKYSYEERTQNEIKIMEFYGLTSIKSQAVLSS